MYIYTYLVYTGVYWVIQGYIGACRDIQDMRGYSGRYGDVKGVKLSAISLRVQYGGGGILSSLSRSIIGDFRSRA